jgi:hypothetical protein
MSEYPEYWTCPHCHAQQDIARLGFFAEIACHHCGRHAHVHSMLSNYKVEAVLGIGGMSVVFQARDLILGRPLAIKVLNDTYRDAPERIAGFENECSLMAKVCHENVVSVYSAGWARGQFYIAMELVEGRNLELIVAEEGRIAPLQAIEIIRQVVQGLQAAHEAGILHRDVKPGNVLIAADGHAKVLDFGLSLEEKNGQDDDEIIWATPYYVPPETLRREEETVRTDIYALGMTLRNLLTGEAVLPGNPQVLADMLVAKKTLPPMQEAAPELDASLCKLVDVLAAFDPADRPADYGEVLKRVNKVQQRLQNAVDPAVRLRRRLRLVYGLAGAVATVSLGLAGAFLVAMRTPSHAVQESLGVEPLRWEPIEVYRQAESALQAGDRVQGGALLERLTSGETEPALAAAATVLHTALDVLDGKAPDNGYRRLTELAGQAGRVCPAGRVLFEQLTALVAAVQTDASRAGELAAALENPLLQLAARVLVADAFICNGQAEPAEQILAEASQGLGPDVAAGLREQLEQYGEAAPRRAARVVYAEIKTLFSRGEFADAETRIQELEQSKLSPMEKEELRVLREASVLMQAILDMMQQKKRRAYAGMPPEELRMAAAGFGRTVTIEFYCLSMLLRGDYETAFRENPYAADEESQALFAVIMRDWKARLGR